MDYDLLKMRRYMLHHRIITYAIILFLILITFILMSISRQIQNEQALILDSQAANTTNFTADKGTCPANGIPARMTYNGATSCYFGQYRSISVRCTDGARAQVIHASTIGSFSVCADKSALEAAAKARCGCTGGVPTPSITPKVGGGGFPVTTPAVVTPTFSVPRVTEVLLPTGFISLKCPRGLKTFTVGTECVNQQDMYKSATYVCNNGKKGSLSIRAGTACQNTAYFLTQATLACKNEPNCPFAIVATPTSTLSPTTVPND